MNKKEYIAKYGDRCADKTLKGTRCTRRVYEHNLCKQHYLTWREASKSLNESFRQLWDDILIRKKRSEK